MALYSSVRARRSLIDTVIFRVVSQVATVVSYVVMVRTMTKEDFGVFNLLYAVIPVVGTVASLGLEQTLRRYQPEFLQSGNPIAANWLVRFVSSARFGTNIIVLSGILAGWNVIAPIFKLESYRVEFVVLCVLVLLHFQVNILQLSLASRMLHRFSVGAMAILAVVKLLAYCALAWSAALTLQAALMAEILAYAAAYICMRYVFQRKCLYGTAPAAYRPDAVTRKRLIRYGLFNNFNDAGSLMLTSGTNSFFIAAFLDPIAVGIYGFYNRLNEMMQRLLPVRVFENVTEPMFFAVNAEAARKRVPQYFSLLLNLNLMLQWPLLAFALAYHEDVVRFVFGGKFLEDSWLLPVIVGFATLNVIAVPITLVAQYEEKVNIILASKVFGILNIAALLALVPVAGIYGAAIATGSSQVMKNAFIWWHVRDRAIWLNWRRAMLSSIGLWGCAVVIAHLLKENVIESVGLNLCTGTALVACAVALHLRGPAIASSDRALLEVLFKGREAAILRKIGLIGTQRP